MHDNYLRLMVTGDIAISSGSLKQMGSSHPASPCSPSYWKNEQSDDLPVRRIANKPYMESMMTSVILDEIVLLSWLEKDFTGHVYPKMSPRS